MKVFGSCDSYTYADILPNGKKISECTREELSEMVDAHSDVYKTRPVLELNCPHCGLTTWFNEIEDIPEENFICPCCGKLTYSHG